MLLAQLALMKCRVPQFWYWYCENFRPWRSPASVGKILKFFGVLQIFTTVLSIWLDWPGWVITNKQCMPQCNSLWICRSLIAQWSEHLLRLQKVLGSIPGFKCCLLVSQFHMLKKVSTFAGLNYGLCNILNGCLINRIFTDSR